MPEPLQMILVFIIMILVIIFSRRIRAAKMMKARDFIINDLKSNGASNKDSAVALDYAHRSFLKIGLRDDRPKVLKQMIQFGVVTMTEDQKFYLSDTTIPTDD
jgi:hypothetical protein